MTAQDPVHALLREAAEQALAIWRGGPRSLRDKATGDEPLDLVTEADLVVDRQVAEGLARLHPSVPLVSEERTAPVGVPADAFVLDPIDGTHNFAAGNPWWTISLARTHGRHVEEAWILHPPTGSLTHAHRAGPTTVDGVPVRVQEGPLRYGLASIAISWELLPLMKKADRFAGLRAIGSYALSLAMTASGRFLIHVGRGRPWDVAAGFLLVERAGGSVLGLDGAPLSPFDGGVALAGSGAAVDEALAMFASR